MAVRVWFYFVFLILFSHGVRAVECTVVFPDGVQNNDDEGVITFNYHGQLKNSPDNILATNQDIIDLSGDDWNSCESGACTESFSIAQPVDITDFGAGEDGDITAIGAVAVTKSPGNYKDLLLPAQSSLTLEPGDYYFTGNFINNSQNNIAIDGNGVVRIFVQGIVTLGAQTGLNENGSPSQLLLYSANNIAVGNEVNVSGFIYSKEDVTIAYQSYVKGAISAKNLNPSNTDQVIEFSAEVPDFGDFCSVPATILLDYRFDECSYGGTGDVTDQTGNFPATPNNSSFSINDNIINNALDLTNSGTNDWLSLSKDAVDGLNDFSMSFWLQTDSSKETQSIFHAVGSSGTDDQLMVLLKGSDNVRVFVADLSVDLDPGITFSNGNWNHFVLTRQSAQVCLYVNGALAECDTGASGIEAELEVNSDEGVVVGQGKTALNGYTFDEDEGLEGKLDEFKLFEGKLKANEIIDIYNNENTDKNYDGSARDEVNCPSIMPIVDYRFDQCSYLGNDDEVIDQSGNDFHATTNNDPPLSEGQLNNAIDLTLKSSSDWIQVPNESVDGLDNFSIAVWIKVSADDINEQSILHALGEDTDDDEIELFFESNKKVKLRVGDQGASLDSAITLADNSWHHIVVTRQSDTACLFVDGVKQECEDDVSDQTTSITEDNAVYLGQRHDDYGSDFKNGYQGLLDEFKIYDVALSSAEVNEIFDNEDEGRNYDGEARQPLNCGLPEVVAGRVTLNNTTGSLKFTYVCFDEPFSSVPVVFSMPTTPDDTDRLALRIRNVTESGFEIAQVESPEDANPNAPAGNLPQTVDFIAITEGVYDLGGGAKMRVATHATQTYQARNIGGASWDTISIADLNFSEEPAILSFIQTMNNEPNTSNPNGPFPISDPFLVTTVNDVSAGEFSLALERGETNSGTISQDEIIGYMAISAGVTGQLSDDISFETLRTSNSIVMNDQCKVFDFSDSYAENPIVVASQNTRDGVDGGWLKRCSLSTASVGFIVVEDMDGDTDDNHTTERAGVLVLGGDFLDYTNSCPTVLDHFEIDTINGQGLTCEPDTISIKACSSADCESLYSDDIDVQLIVANTGGVVSNNVITVIGGESEFNYRHIVAEQVSLSLDQTYQCRDSISTPCSVDFANAGFVFSFDQDGAGTSYSEERVIPNQVAGVAFDSAGGLFKIHALKDDYGECVTALDGTATIQMAQENVDPTGSTGLSFTVEDSDGDDVTLNKYPNISTDVELTFDDGSAILPNAIYNDAGQIKLHASYVTGGLSIIGSSTNFWVAPDYLELTAESLGSDIDGNTATHSTTHKAGQSFDLTVTAKNRQGNTTLNYSHGQNTLKLTRTGPSSGGVEGVLTYASASTLTSQLASAAPVFTNSDLTSFTNGVSTFSGAKYDEVGLINIDIQDVDYGGQGIVVNGDDINVGRFTPSHFALFSGAVTNAYTDTTYMSQPELLLDYQVDAQNENNETTENYFGSYNTADIAFQAENNNSGTALDTRLTGFGGSWSAGVYRDDNTAGKFSRLISAVDGPYESMLYGISVTDDDGITISNKNMRSDTAGACTSSGASATDCSAKLLSSTESKMLFARWFVENTFGPETQNLPVPMQIQYYNGTTFVTETSNSITNFDATNTTVTNDIASVTTTASGDGTFLIGETTSLNHVMLSAPGAGNRGNAKISYSVDDWLQYDWDDEDGDANGPYDDNPSGIATFGIFRGNDRIIYWREIIN